MEEEKKTLNPEFEQTLEGSPEFTQNIRKKPYFKKEPATAPLDVNFTPYNHFSINAPTSDEAGYAAPDTFKPEKESVGFIDASSAQYKHINDTWHYLHAGLTQLDKPWGAPKDPNFNPLDHSDLLTDIDPMYYAYLTENVDNIEDLKFRLTRVREEQQSANDIKNGSWLGYLAGGGAGIVTDLTNLIPIVGQLKYAKMGQSFLMNAARTLPGAAAYGTASSIGESIDSINGNVQDTITDMLTKTLFVTALGGGLGATGWTLDKAKLWEAQSWMTDYIKGIGVKIKVDKQDNIVGYQAYDMTNGSLSADSVKLAQDKLDSSFSKTGVFGIPYIGEAATKFLGNSVYGSSILRILNSNYPTLRQLGDLYAEHGIYTTGTEAGNRNPIKFTTLMKQTHAAIRNQEVQLNALHLERNGFDFKNYVAQNAVKAGMLTREKTFEMLSREVGDKGYVTREQFYGEIETVLHSKTPDPNGAVNTAASILREAMDKSYSNWREAYNLPKDWMPPIQAEGYLMRVYDTNFLNNNFNVWVRKISNYLKESDEVILKHTQPIKDITAKIEAHTIEHDRLTDIPNVTDAYKKQHRDELVALKAQKKALEEELQNKIRTDPSLHLLTDEWNNLSADEAKELMQITKKKDIAREIGRAHV